MLTKTVTYTDYDGQERTETFYFNLTKAELTKLQYKHPGGYGEYLKRITESKENAQIMQAFEDLVDLSYGVKSEDGKRFIKNETVLEEFKQTEAYSELFVELLTNVDAATAFANGILPDMDLTEAQKAEINEKTKALIDSKKAE